MGAGGLGLGGPPVSGLGGGGGLGGAAVVVVVVVADAVGRSVVDGPGSRTAPCGAVRCAAERCGALRRCGRRDARPAAAAAAAAASGMAALLQRRRRRAAAAPAPAPAAAAAAAAGGRADGRAGARRRRRRRRMHACDNASAPAARPTKRNGPCPHAIALTLPPGARDPGRPPDAGAGAVGVWRPGLEGERARASEVSE